MEGYNGRTATLSASLSRAFRDAASREREIAAILHSKLRMRHPNMNAPEPPGWKTKLFGDTQTNFYGWIFGGLLVMGSSLCFVSLAMRAGALRSPVCLLLLAIYLVLIGILGVAVQYYLSRVAKSLDSKRPEKDESNFPS
jgi:hypothetical protein